MMPTTKEAKLPVPIYQESDMAELVEEKFPGPAWTTLFGVRDSTGFAGEGRTADGMAFGTWPSRGFQILGFEMKSFRGDWLRELKNPAKAENIFRYCDEWYLVASEAVANMEEIPSGWGWYQPTAKGLKLAKKAEVLDRKTIDRVFLMSLIRNIGKSYVSAKRMKAMAEKRAKELMDAETEEMKRKTEWQVDLIKNLQGKIDAFQKASGISMDEEWRYDSGQVGSLVKVIMEEGRIIAEVESIRKIAGTLADIMEKINQLGWVKKKD